MQGSQPVGNLLNACGVQRRSVRYRGCWTPPPAACQTPRRPSPKAPSMGADLDRTSACARTMLGIFEPECRVPGLRQSAAALLRQIAWAGLSGRVTAEALPRCFGGVRRAGSEHLTVQEPAYPLGPRFAGPRQGLAGGCAPFDPPEVRAAACVFAQRRTGSDRCRSRTAWRLRSRPMPVPDAVHVRVRATDWRHNPVTTLNWAPEIYSGAHFNAPGRARTCDLWIRSPLLYPAELRAPEAAVFPAETWWKLTKRGSSSTSVARRER